MPERWAAIERLYHEALARPEGEREAFLERECRGDDDSAARSAVASESRGVRGEFSGRPRGAGRGAGDESAGRRPVLTGLRLGVYEVQAPLGAGGMGVVYRALDTNLNRPVAIKFLSDELADPAARRRFQREAQTASSLNHPHIRHGARCGRVRGPSVSGHRARRRRHAQGVDTRRDAAAGARPSSC